MMEPGARAGRRRAQHLQRSMRRRRGRSLGLLRQADERGQTLDGRLRVDCPSSVSSLGRHVAGRRATCVESRGGVVLDG